MNALRVLLVTDSFPPNCGGSGWSTWELTRGLRRGGHAVDVVHVRQGSEDRVFTTDYEGVPVTTFGFTAPTAPFVRNMAKNERLWRRVTTFLADRLRDRGADVVHAQHVMTTVPAVRAGRARGVPVVATVRDYWPVCYWSDLIYDPTQPHLCPACSAGMMTRCLRPRAGAATPAAWPMIPYMRWHLRTKRRALSQASAVIAVSSVIAADLVRRAPELDPTRVHTVPNPFDMSALDEAHARAERPRPDPYVLYVGKLATNKGAQFLVPALADAGVSLPVVVVGDGPLRPSVESAAAARGLDLRVVGWRPRDEVWAWMRHARVLAYPSYGPESLSRVLVEAAALGTPIAAMATGGTGDILTHQSTALLSSSADAWAADVRTLATHEETGLRLGAAARADVHARFDAPGVVTRVEQVYRLVLQSPAV